MKKIHVVWIDAALESHNISPEEAKGLQPIERENVGYEMSNDKDNLRLAFGIIYDHDNNLSACDNTLVIPQGMIKSIKKLT